MFDLVGVLVGNWDGATVELRVGSTDGFRVGLIVVGLVLGVQVGLFVGRKVGVAVVGVSVVG